MDGWRVRKGQRGDAGTWRKSLNVLYLDIQTGCWCKMLFYTMKIMKDMKKNQKVELFVMEKTV